MIEHPWPLLNACLNGLAGVCLVFGYRAIRSGRKETHRKFMTGALTASSVFLISYLLYHFNHGSTRFETPGLIKTVYLAILLTHTILATAIVPLVLITVRRAIKGQFDAHKRIARWTWPLWMYVSVTGVVIYLMLYHLDPALAR